MTDRVLNAEELPELLDARKLAGELNVTRAAAEAIMRQSPAFTLRVCERCT